MSTPADISDVIKNFERPLSTAEAAVVPAWLDQAWTKFRKGIVGAEARLGVARDDPRYIDRVDVKATLAEMVIRRLRNPDGLRTWNDDTYGQTVDNALSSGAIYLSEAEKAEYALPDQNAGGGMYSIPLTR